MKDKLRRDWKKVCQFLHSARIYSHRMSLDLLTDWTIRYSHAIRNRRLIVSGLDLNGFTASGLRSIDEMAILVSWSGWRWRAAGSRLAGQLWLIKFGCFLRAYISEYLICFVSGRIFKHLWVVQIFLFLVPDLEFRFCEERFCFGSRFFRLVSTFVLTICFSIWDDTGGHGLFVP